MKSPIHCQPDQLAIDNSKRNLLEYSFRIELLKQRVQYGKRIIGIT